MSKTLPSLNGLEAFHEAARHMSFSRGAEALHITQSAVSHRIRTLETELGFSLFVRTPRRLSLTEEGQALARATTDAFARLHGGLAEVDTLRRRGMLTVSCSPSFAIRWLVPRLPDLAREMPGIDVRVAADDRLVRPGQDGVDVCIRYGPGPYAGGLVARRLTIERRTPVCNPTLLARSPVQAPSALGACTLLHDEVLANVPGHIGWAEWLTAAGVSASWAERGPRFSHAHMAIEAALAGQGWALGRLTLVERELADGRLVAPFKDLCLESSLAYWLVAHPTSGARACVGAFGEWLEVNLQG